MQRSSLSGLEDDDAIFLSTLLMADDQRTGAHDISADLALPRFDKLSFEEWSREMHEINESMQDGALPTLNTSGTSPSSLIQTFLRQHQTPPEDRRLPDLHIIPSTQHQRDNPIRGSNLPPLGNLPPDRSNSAPLNIVISPSPSYNQIQPLTYSPLTRQLTSLNPFHVEPRPPPVTTTMSERDSLSGGSPLGQSPNSSRKRVSSSGQSESHEHLSPKRGKRHSSAGETLLTNTLSLPGSFSLSAGGPQRYSSFPAVPPPRASTTSEQGCCHPSTSDVLCRAILEQQALFQRQMQMIQEDQAKLMAESSKQTQTLVAALVAKHIARKSAPHHHHGTAHGTASPSSSNGHSVSFCGPSSGSLLKP